MNEEGEANMEDRHPNYGYSGTILVFVWDGERWAWLRKKDKPKFPTGFDYQYESRGLIEKYINYFKSLEKTEPRFWWYKGKRFAAITPKEDIHPSHHHNSPSRKQGGG
jgi:hypothetical protein